MGNQHFKPQRGHPATSNNIGFHGALAIETVKVRQKSRLKPAPQNMETKSINVCYLEGSFKCWSATQRH